MATPVPYTGVPQEAPREATLPRPYIDVPLAAFGGLSAEATTKLGSTFDRVGDELFSRAISMEQLHQEALANEASTNATTQMGIAQSKYLTLEGKNAVDALGDHLQDINSIREQGRQSLPSPYAQSLYDRDSRTVQNWNIRVSAGHAATQGKQYFDNSLKAGNESIDNQALAAPMDDAAFKAAMDAKMDKVHQLAVSGGWSPEREKLESQNEASKLTSNRLITIAKTDPSAAKQKLDEATSAGQINGLDAARVGDQIQKIQYGVGARHDAARALAGGDTSYGEAIVSMPRAMEAIGNKESGGRYTTDVMSFDSRGHEQHALGKYGIMDFNLQGWLKEAGMPAMSSEQFKASPEAQDQLFTFKFDQLQKKYGNFNGAASEWFGGAGWSATEKPDKFGTTVPKYLADLNATLARSASRGDIDRVARGIAAKSAPGDDLYADIVADRAAGLHENDIKIQKENEFNNMDTINTALVAGDKDGKIPTTIEELQAVSPDVAKAWDSIKSGSPDYMKIMKVLSENAKGDYRFSPESLRQYQRMMGAAVSPDASPEDRQMVLDADILDMKIPWANRLQLLKARANVFKQAEADPNLAHAMGVMAPTLSLSGLTKASDPDGYNQFTGAMRDEIADYQRINKKLPKDEEIELMGKRLLQKQNAHWWSSGTELFRIQVPDEAAEIIRNDPAWAKQGITPSDEDIQRIYVRSQYQKLYGTTTAAP